MKKILFALFSFVLANNLEVKTMGNESDWDTKEDSSPRSAIRFETTLDQERAKAILDAIDRKREDQIAKCASPKSRTS